MGPFLHSIHGKAPDQIILTEYSHQRSQPTFRNEAL